MLSLDDVRRFRAARESAPWTDIIAEQQHNFRKSNDLKITICYTFGYPSID